MSSLPCILIPAIVGVICGILGYLIGRMAWNGTEGGRASTLKAELEACRSNTKHLSAKVEKLEEEIKSANSSAKTKTDNLVNVVPVKKASTPKPKAKPAATVKKSGDFDAAAAKAALGKRVTNNDLKAIEGVGPKIAELFKAAGINTWKDMAETPLAKSKAILKEAGDRYAIHNPGTWAKQAKMMSEGKWKELKAWQDKLDGGKK